MDGFALLAELGRTGALEATRVVVASTLADPATRRRVLDLGAHGLRAQADGCRGARRGRRAAARRGRRSREAGPTRPPAPDHPEPIDVRAPMESPLILVIDDSPTILKMVECHLSQAGYRVATAPNAEAGVAAAEAIRPDLILLDHQLPGTTGDEVCRRLLESEATATIPVVISSAMRNRAFAAYTELPNVVDQIPKPFTPDLLKTGVANALQVGRDGRPGAADRLRHARGRRRGAGGDARGADRGLPAAGGARLPEQRPVRRPADARAGARTASASPSPAAGSRRSTRRRSARTGCSTCCPPSSPSWPRCWPRRSASSSTRRCRAWSGCSSGACPTRGGSAALLRAQAAVLTHWALTAGPGRFAFEPDTARAADVPGLPAPAEPAGPGRRGGPPLRPDGRSARRSPGSSSPGSRRAGGTSTGPGSRRPR